MDSQEFEQVVGEFFKGCQAPDDQLAMDGKSLRGTIEAGHTRGVHLLAVYAVGAGVVLNQVNVLSKENEISAAPKVLAGVDLNAKAVTGDAMFTQRELSARIVEAGGLSCGNSRITNLICAPILSDCLALTLHVPCPTERVRAKGVREEVDKKPQEG